MSLDRLFIDYLKRITNQEGKTKMTELEEKMCETNNLEMFPEDPKQPEQSDEKTPEQIEAKEANTLVNDLLAKLETDFGMKVMVVGYSEKRDDFGLWQSKKLTDYDKFALTKFIETCI